MLLNLYQKAKSTLEPCGGGFLAWRIGLCIAFTIGSEYVVGHSVVIADPVRGVDIKPHQDEQRCRPSPDIWINPADDEGRRLSHLASYLATSR